MQVSQVNSGNSPALRLELKAYVLDTQFEKDYLTDVTLRVMEAFEQEGIGPPAILHRHAGDAGPGIRSKNVASGS